MDRHETLKRHYAEEIASWDWSGIVEDAKANSDAPGSCYLGTVMDTYPSGKYYAPWTSNQTSHDEQRDAAFGEALEEKAAEFGGWIESGEGDPCDLYFGMNAEEKEETNGDKAKDGQEASAAE